MTGALIHFRSSLAAEQTSLENGEQTPHSLLVGLVGYDG